MSDNLQLRRDLAESLNSTRAAERELFAMSQRLNEMQAKFDAELQKATAHVHERFDKIIDGLVLVRPFTERDDTRFRAGVKVYLADEVFSGLELRHAQFDLCEVVAQRIGRRVEDAMRKELEEAK